jgi:hypothetical protein
MGTNRALLTGLGNSYKTILLGSYPPFSFLEKNVSKMYSHLKVKRWQTKILLEKEATKINILKSLEEMIDASKPNDQLLFYFCGHGDKGQFSNRETEFGDEYLITFHKDLRYRKNITSEAEIEEFFILDNTFTSLLKTINDKITIIIILDCCKSGGMIDEIERIGRINENFKNIIFFSSSIESMDSYATNDYSLFTLSLLNASIQSKTIGDLAKITKEYLAKEYAGQKSLILYDNKNSNRTSFI